LLNPVSLYKADRNGHSEKNEKYKLHEKLYIGS